MNSLPSAFSKSVYQGQNSVLDFLNPDNCPPTPLVELPDALNPHRKSGLRIFAKMMNMLPLGNVKSLPAYSMLQNESRAGGLTGIDTVIENSSGNTVFSLAVIARLMGIPHTKAIVSNHVSKGKLDMLRFLGTEIIVNKEPICPDPSDPTSGIYKARQWADENGWYNPGQYDNAHNPSAHERWTGPQIWDQTGGHLDFFAAGLGTTGTMVGAGSFIKKQNPNIQTIGVIRSPNNPLPGVRTKSLLNEIAFDWKSVVDHSVEIGTHDAFRLSLEMCRHGLFVGPSSGFALAGLLKHMSTLICPECMHGNGRDSDREKIAVFICPDSPFPYIGEYFECLGADYFPEMQNAHLLCDPSAVPEHVPGIEEIEPIALSDMLSGELEGHHHDYAIVDLRHAHEFDEHHINGAINIPYHDLEGFLDTYIDEKKSAAKIIFICGFGNISRLAAWKAKQKGMVGISLKGGDAEWSRLNLPRVRAKSCTIRH